MNKQKIKHMPSCHCKCAENAGKDLEARSYLQLIYNSLADAVNGASDLEYHFISKSDKRSKKATKAVDLIMKVQELLNPMAEDEDICLAE